MASDIISLQIKPAGGTLTVGTAIQLNLTAMTRGGRTGLIPGNAAAWSSSDDHVADVNRQGRLNPRRPGPVTITVTYEGKTVMAEFIAEG